MILGAIVPETAGAALMAGVALVVDAVTVELGSYQGLRPLVLANRFRRGPAP